MIVQLGLSCHKLSYSSAIPFLMQNPLSSFMKLKYNSVALTLLERLYLPTIEACSSFVETARLRGRF